MNERKENDKNAVKAAYDSMAKDYDKIVVEARYAVTSWLQAELKHCSANQVLDLACGSGNLGVVVRSINPLADLVGLDLSTGMLAQASEKKIYSRLVPHDLDQSLQPLNLPQADVVLIFGVLEFLREPLRLLEEASGLLQPGGHLLCSFHERLDGQSESIPNTHGFTHHAYTTGDVEGLIAGAGLQLNKSDHVTGYISPSSGTACPYLLVHAVKRS